MRAKFRVLVTSFADVRKALPLILLIFACVSAIAEECDLGSKTEREVCEETNWIREEQGERSLMADPNLQEMAQEYARLLWEHNRGSASWRLSHDLRGHEFVVRKRRWGIRGFAGENIAAGQQSVDSVLKGWMRSPGHMANILESRYRRIGTAHWRGLWVQVFAE